MKGGLYHYPAKPRIFHILETVFGLPSEAHSRDLFRPITAVSWLKRPFFHKYGLKAFAGFAVLSIMMEEVF